MFTGKRWERDASGAVVQLAKDTVRSIYREAAEEKDDKVRQAILDHAKRSERLASIRAMLKLAQSEKQLVAMPDALDSDRWLLNVNNGTLDLRTGDLRKHQPSDLLTKLAPVSFDADATHELFDRFMGDITGGDAELARFLQQLAGYCATGLNTEKRFYFVFGEPDTGKSTYLDMLRAVLGDYAMHTAPDTWLSRPNVGGNRGDLARLMGARLVTASEFKRSARFDEGLINMVTGGDPVTVAAKYEKEFTYVPTYKVMLAANDAPRISDTDAGMWERCLRMPFCVRIEKKDPKVKQLLCDVEKCGPAILAWLVRGCLDWRTNGLVIPETVKRSTAEYRDEMDPVREFFNEALVFEGAANCTKQQMRASYIRWCDENSIRYPLAAPELKKRLESKGAAETRNKRCRLWRGVRIAEGWESNP